jgi:hypothetical protein
MHADSDVYVIVFSYSIIISYRPETRGISQKITLRDEISEGEARGIFHPAG